jgi:methylated-DNA-protein-cysteine methyltransferase-like protein
MKMKPGEFSKNVWKLALQIPSGKVTTYGSLAVAAGGHPMMAQMITSILSKSPDVDRIPFHRIVYADGRVWLSPEYQAIRRRLYKEEGIKLDKNNRIIGFDKLVYLFKK